MRNLSQLNNAIKTEMQLDPGLISDAERISFINDALFDLSTLNVFHKNVTITAVSGIVQYPEDYKSILWMKIHDGRMLNPLPITTYISSSTGEPIGYIARPDVIVLYPKTSNDIQLDMAYMYSPVMLVNDDDIPDIPNGWDSLIILYAVAACHRKNGNTLLSREYKNEYIVKSSQLQQQELLKINSTITPTYNQDYIVTPPTPFDYL